MAGLLQSMTITVDTVCMVTELIHCQCFVNLQPNFFFFFVNWHVFLLLFN